MRTATCTADRDRRRHAVGVSSAPPSARARAPARCQREISKGFAKFTQAKMKALGALPRRRADAGRSPAHARTARPRPRSARRRPSSGARSTRSAAARTASAAPAPTSRSRRSAGTAAACPNFESGACTNAINDCGDVADCLLCVGKAAVDQAVEPLLRRARADAAIRPCERCQREIGRSAVKAFRAETKALQKCADARLKGSGQRLVSGSQDHGAGRARAREGGRQDLPDLRRLRRRLRRQRRSVAGGDRVPGDVPLGHDARRDGVRRTGQRCQGLVQCVSCVTVVQGRLHRRHRGAPNLEHLSDAVQRQPAGDAHGRRQQSDADGDPVALRQRHDRRAARQCDGANAAACPGECSAELSVPGALHAPGADHPRSSTSSSCPGSIPTRAGRASPTTCRTATTRPFGAGRLANCDWDLESPTCGQCDVVGTRAVPRRQPRTASAPISGSRDASSRTICDPEAPSCTGGESCECYQGAILPVSSGGAPGCIVNRFTQPLTGTINVALSGPHAGESELGVRVESAVHNGLGAREAVSAVRRRSGLPRRHQGRHLRRRTAGRAAVRRRGDP